MNKKIKKGKAKVSSVTLIFFATVLQFSLGYVMAQETKKEKCDKFGDALQTFSRECYNEEYLNTFSPELVDNLLLTDSSEEFEMLKLDVFFQIIQNSQATGYIVVYGGRINKYGEYDIRVERITGYTFGTRAQDRSRIKVVHGGFRERFEIELWTSPIKNAFPPLSPTIAPEKVKFKGRMKPFSP